MALHPDVLGFETAPLRCRTVALPPAWHGDFTVARARAWIDRWEPDSTALLTERLADAGATVHAVDTSTAMLDVLHSKHDLVASGRVVTDIGLAASPPRFRDVVRSSVCGHRPQRHGRGSLCEVGDLAVPSIEATQSNGVAPGLSRETSGPVRAGAPGICVAHRWSGPDGSTTVLKVGRG